MDTCSRRFREQLAFIEELDSVKSVLRQTLLLDGSRRENDAEHSWHIALMSLVLAEYASGSTIDSFRVLFMLLIHDVVEIDAGDTYCYDDDARRDQKKREERAADRIFNMLPEDQAAVFRGLWNEFECRQTPEAQFAAALDRLQPLIHNYRTKGHMWRLHGITSEKVKDRMKPLADGAPKLWDFALFLIDDAVSKGFLAP